MCDVLDDMEKKNWRDFTVMDPHCRFVLGKMRAKLGDVAVDDMCEAIWEAGKRAQIQELMKIQFSYVISSDEIKYSGGPERFSEMKEHYERDLFYQLGDKIREEKLYSQGHPKAPNPFDIMKTVTVLVYKPQQS